MDLREKFGCSHIAIFPENLGNNVHMHIKKNCKFVNLRVEPQSSEGSVHIYICIYIYIVYVYMYIYMQIYIQIYICIYICMYKYLFVLLDLAD